MTLSSSSEEDKIHLSPQSRKPINRSRRWNRRLPEYALLAMSLTFSLLLCIEVVVLEQRLSTVREEGAYPCSINYIVENISSIFEQEFKKYQTLRASPNDSHILTIVLTKTQAAIAELWRVARSLDSRIKKLEKPVKEESHEKLSSQQTPEINQSKHPENQSEEVLKLRQLISK